MPETPPPAQGDRQRTPATAASRWGRAPLTATALAAVLILIGTLVWFVPYLTKHRQLVAGVPAPPLSLKATPGAGPTLREFPVRGGARACMSSITLVPAGHAAEFQLSPALATTAGGPPVDVVFTAPGYRSVAHVAAGYLEGNTRVSLRAPAHPLIGSVCFINRGHATVELDGTNAPGVVYRSGVTINGRPASGQIALTFLGAHRRALSARLGEIFGHVSVLTDRLVPVWLVWLLAILVAFGVTLGVLYALYLAVREDEARAAS